MMTARIEGPFDIRATNYVLKPTFRSLAAVGPRIAGAVADETLSVVAEGRGLSNRDDDRLLEQSTQKEAMRLVPSAEAAEGLVFDLNGTYELESLEIWNYNEPGYTVRGVAQADVSVWTAEGGWKTVLRQAKLNQAEGTDDYDEPTLLSFAPTSAQKVRLENLTPFADEGFVGLSAVRFYEKATLAACNPQPSSETPLPCTDQVTLAWTPGKEAVAHDIYAAAEGEEPILLGRIAQSQVALSGLVGGKRYVWRADQVRQDGSVTVSPVWSFTMEQGRCVAHWPLDGTYDDVSGYGRHAVGQGNPVFRDGRVAQAVEFDKRSHLECGMDADPGAWPQITVSAWVKTGALSNAWATIIGKGVKSWRLARHYGTSQAAFHANTARGEAHANGSATIVDDAWHFVAGTFDGQTIKLYVDGKLDASSSANAQGPINQTADPVWIGGRSDNPERGWEGLIDDVRVLDYALGAEQIAALAEGRDGGLSAADAAAKLSLAGVELLDVKADLKAVAAEQQARAAEAAAVPRRNLLPVLIIVAVIIAAGFVVRMKKQS